MRVRTESLHGPAELVALVHGAIGSLNSIRSFAKQSDDKARAAILRHCDRLYGQIADIQQQLGDEQ